MSGIRPPAVSGLFYPDNPQQLARYVRSALQQATADLPHLPTVRAIVAPHAGYRFSGPIAAHAFAALAERGPLRRIVLLGPAHTVPLRGIAAPAWDGFATPLGIVKVDKQAREAIADLPQVVIDNVPHAREHALEVQLPFIQTLFPNAKVLPLVVGATTPQQVSQVIDLLDDDETGIIISSDLSHYEPYEQARMHDAHTAEKIAALDDAHIGPHDTCGAYPLSGLLNEARRRHWKPVLLDLRNSGDTAGDKSRVVGYGAWAFVEDAQAA